MVDLGPPVGRAQAGFRPAVVVSADHLNAALSGIAMVVPCTTTARGLPSHIEIEPNGSGLTDTSYAKAEDLRSVSTLRLRHRLGAVSPPVLFDLSRTIRFLLDL